MMAASAIGFLLICILIISPSAKVNATRTTVPLVLESAREGQSGSWSKSPGVSAIESARQDELQYRLMDGAQQSAEISKENARDQDQQEHWQTIQIKEGHTLSTLFAAAGFNDAVMYAVLGQKSVNTALSKIFPGEKVSFLKDDKQQLIKIKLQRSPL